MKPMLLLALFALGVLQSKPALAATKFVDLTAQEYKGSDADLSGFNLTRFGVNCEENGSYTSGQDAYVSWVNESRRSVPRKAIYGTRRYTIHFRVKDRKGNVIHEEDFTYSRIGAGSDRWPYKGKVIHAGDPEFHCDRDAIRFSKKVDLSFATVEYWVTKIEWMAKP